MLINTLFILGTIAIITIHDADALYCYQCFECDKADKIECTEDAVINLNKATDAIFHPVSPTTGDRFDCITLVYLNGESSAKFQGCIYDSDYTCSVSPRSLETAFVCGTCKSDLCNSSAGFPDAKIFFGLLSTIVAILVARLL